MKISKYLIMFFAFVSIGLFSGTIYASDESNVKVETVIKNDKKVDIIVSEDKYVRISELAKASTSTFESKMNIMGETKQGTDIVIEVYNTKTDNLSLSKNVTSYTLNTVGITETFNQLIELLEGENKVVLTYTNEKDKKDKLQMIFYITRESEETKELLKNMRVYAGTKDAGLTSTIKTNALK
ncbi:hypothetical protein [Cellulosilyticum sp. I15G10I2]|uniref:hypothetical protein n=1 Tax=Cellulosilyticum sp. I15G10I2 TaxID=1892843 RepID=UPI00085BF513|nr:hypothetical protein [Cellulosilyticum sp. I15G10I2]